MTPIQITELIIGIAKTQAAIINAVSVVVENGNIPSQIKQKVDLALHGLRDGQHQQPPQWSSLNAQALQVALAPMSSAMANLQQTMLAQVEILLQEHQQ